LSLKKYDNGDDNIMKKIIVLAILLMIVISCTELAEMEARSQQRRSERGRICRYNYKGEVQSCDYIIK
jgi:lipoprotein